MVVRRASMAGIQTTPCRCCCNLVTIASISWAISGVSAAPAQRTTVRQQVRYGIEQIPQALLPGHAPNKEDIRTGRINAIGDQTLFVGHRGVFVGINAVWNHRNGFRVDMEETFNVHGCAARHCNDGISHLQRACAPPRTTGHSHGRAVLASRDVRVPGMHRHHQREAVSIFANMPPKWVYQVWQWTTAVLISRPVNARQVCSALSGEARSLALQQYRGIGLKPLDP